MNFVGEGSIDHGGPKREFFRLLAEQACTYFRGDDRQPKFLRNNILAVQVIASYIAICYICNMARSDLPDMYTQARECAALEGECGHIRQIMTAYVTYVM